jgi:hypothetical protein
MSTWGRGEKKEDRLQVERAGTQRRKSLLQLSQVETLERGRKGSRQLLSLSPVEREFAALKAASVTRGICTSGALESSQVQRQPAQLMMKVDETLG